MKDQIGEFLIKIEEEFSSNKAIAESKLNLGNTYQNVDFEDAMKFMEIFNRFSTKICKIADFYEAQVQDNESKKFIDSITKQYILKFKILFKFPS